MLACTWTGFAVHAADIRLEDAVQATWRPTAIRSCC
jgi:hypothetical protein